jgi:RNA polymerase sigma factor (sigma-70 family)
VVEITEAVASDPVLPRLLEAEDGEARREELGRVLLEQARPTIAAVVARFARSESAFSRDEEEDVVATVMLRLVRRLHATEGVEDESIRDFEGYVATLTYRTIYDFMRERYPERTRLKNRIRYLLGHDPRFALWTTGAGTFCGRKSWDGREDALDDLIISRSMASRVMLVRERPHDAVAAIFDRAGLPLTLETLVRIVAELWGIVDARPAVTDDDIPTTQPNPTAHVEMRQFLESLWTEIQLLPQNQRVALLLNSRDAEDVHAVALILTVGVAALGEVAAVMGMKSEELLALWERLPLDDRAIAARLGVTRQQVINLRRSARERLARRTLSNRPARRSR